MNCCRFGMHIIRWKQTLVLQAAPTPDRGNQLQNFQALSGNTVAFDLRWINRVYTEKQRLIIRYTGDYTSGRHTLEQFFEALIPSPEQI
ncbi:hypothetical protein T05_13292 [Trichinella murrelli]|uniref:Uncharacterized protein n=1 Tax=Trichinella murrelli TaxID=144512 RepID=A0A0V0TP87_9BILA|nr:hypothetical protein T05_13292 [Trichinella murrelli]